MTALFSKPKVDKKAQEEQLAAQRRQEERIREQEMEENIEAGGRSRVINARLRTRGVPQLLNANTGAANQTTLG